MQFLCSPMSQLIGPSPGLRPSRDDAVRLAFTQYPASPRPRAANDEGSTLALNDIEDADYKYEARLAQLDLLTAFASPESSPNKRKGVFNMAWRPFFRCYLSYSS